jgi:hypothetical protein
MATKTITLTGISKYAQVYPETMDKKYGKFSVTLQLDEVSKLALKASGSTVKQRTFEGDDGVWFKFSRDNEREFKGVPEILGPPLVMKRETGDPADKNYVKFTDSIGNGSKLTIKVSVYTTSNGYIGTRLEKVLVDEHVPYIPKEQHSDPDNPVF